MSLSVSLTKKASPFSPSFMCRLTGSPLISMSTCVKKLLSVCNSVHEKISLQNMSFASVTYNNVLYISNANAMQGLLNGFQTFWQPPPQIWPLQSLLCCMTLLPISLIQPKHDVQVTSPLFPSTSEHPSCQSGHERVNTVGSCQADAPQWHLYSQTGWLGSGLGIAPSPAQRPDRLAVPRNSWSDSEEK